MYVVGAMVHIVHDLNNENFSETNFNYCAVSFTLLLNAKN